MDNFRKCYEPHLRDYPDCFQECECDVCEAPLFSEPENRSIKCGNCGVFRNYNAGIVEECLNCGDDEYDINEYHDIP